MDNLGLQQLLLLSPNGDFSISCIPSLLLNCSYFVRKSCLFFPIFFSTCLFTSLWTYRYSFYSMDVNLILSLFILLFKFSRLQPCRIFLAGAGTFSTCSRLFLSTFFLLTSQDAPVSSLIFSIPDQESTTLPGSRGGFLLKNRV